MTGTLWPEIMLIGDIGQVGWELRRTLAPLGRVTAFSPEQIDLTVPEQIRKQVRAVKPNLIVNAAAYTAVDKAEGEPELAMAVNGTAPGILAEEAKKVNAVLVHYSTDYVFDGKKSDPYVEQDVPNPLNVYGVTKLAGDRAIQAVGVPHIILRTSWVYGIRGSNFLLTVMRLAREREELRIVDDQIGSPTWSRMIAEVTAQILVQGRSTVIEKQGIYNLTSGGRTSWHGFAGRIIGLMPEKDLLCKKVIPIPTSEYPTPARRPAYSVLSNEKLNRVFGLTTPDWDYALKLALDCL